MNVISKLGAPLKAEIELLNLTADEQSSLTVKIPNADTFKLAGLDFNPAITLIRVDVVKNDNGTTKVLLSSATSISEPLLDVLIELNWSTGRIVREYSVLLDPADLNLPQQDSSLTQLQVPNDSGGPTLALSAPISNTTNDSAVTITDTQTASAAPNVAPPAALQNKPVSDSSIRPTYVVRSGDTAYGIANRATQRNSGDLSMVLAAIFSQNPEAFINGDVNKVKAGAVITLQNESQAKALEQSASNLDLRTQNFSAYRHTIAQKVHKPSAARATDSLDKKPKSASGKVTAKVTDSTKTDQTRDQLKVAGTAKVGAKQVPNSAGNESKSNNKQEPSAEVVASNQRAISEEKAKTAILEKNIAELKKALEVKNDKLSSIAGAASNKNPAAAKPTDTSAHTPVLASTASSNTANKTADKSLDKPVAVAPLPPLDTKSDVKTTNNPPTTAIDKQGDQGQGSTSAAATAPAQPAVNQVAESAPKAPVKKPVVLPPKTALESEWYSDIDPLHIMGVGLIFVLLGGYILWRNRRSNYDGDYADSRGQYDGVPNSILAGDGGHAVDTQNSAFSTSFAPANVGIDAAEVDPLAEADVYIQYGREAHAIEILKDALSQDPNRIAVRLKLMEAYAKMQNLSELEKQAREVQSLSGGKGEYWQQAQSIGKAADKQNPLYGGSDSAGSGQQFAKNVSSKSNSTPVSGVNRGLPPSLSKVDFTTPTAIGDVPIKPTNQVTSAVTQALGDKLDSLNFASTIPAVEPKTKPSSPNTIPSALNVSLDFDVSSPASQIASKPFDAKKQDSKGALNIDTKPAASIDFNLSEFNLGASKTNSAVAKQTSSDGKKPASPEQDFDTKLNLAEAYAEIGDKEGAKELLQEMIATGSPSAVAKAKAMLSKL